MPYNSNIPQPTDQISVSQNDLLGNFQALANVIIPNNGAIKFPNQGVAPVFPANQVGMYAQVPGAPISLLSELHVSKNIFGGGTSQIPLTASILSNAIPAANSNGWTYLPSGILLQWGTAAIADNQNLTAVNFPIPFPNACLNVFVTEIQSSNGNTPPIMFRSNTLTTTQFSVGSKNGASGNTSRLAYLAIGF